MGLDRAFLVALGLLNGVFRTFDVAGPFRDAFLAMAARRLKYRSSRPSSVERTYWTAAEYQRDAARLAALGYEVTSEADSSPYVEGASYRERPPMRIRVPIAHVMYELRP